MSDPIVHHHADDPALIAAAAHHLQRSISQGLARRGSFRLALSGGRTPRALYRFLAAPDVARQIDWARVELFWGDERCVPATHDASNYRMVQETLLRHLDVLPRVHRIEAELAPENAAIRYAAHLGEEPLDMVLLGMGADGHVASLFPSTPNLLGERRAVIVTRSPVKPTQRVTLSLRSINAASEVVFLVTGASKAAGLASVMKQIAEDNRVLPAAMVRSAGVAWYVDDDAASCLTTTDGAGA